MKNIKYALAFSIVVLLAPLQGCGSIWHFQSEQNEMFLSNVPWPVSTAWRSNAGEVWVVPKRGVVIDRILDSRGAASWSAQGSYVVIRGNPQMIRLLVNDQWWALDAREESQKSWQRERFYAQ